MTTITAADGTEIFYKDWGSRDAKPLFFHHGWQLSADDWDSQMMFFLAQGHRVIAHDRRGHGRLSQTADGHDMDIFSKRTSLYERGWLHSMGRMTLITGDERRRRWSDDDRGWNLSQIEMLGAVSYWPRCALKVSPL